MRVEKWGCRIGWSTGKSNLLLGYDVEGFGYDNSGYKLNNMKSKKYSEVYKKGDILRSCIDLDDNHTISFFKNGTFLGYAFVIPNKLLPNAFYPHFVCKNVKAQINFGGTSSIPLYILYL